MARITIVTPTGAGTRTGNLHTAQRYARFLRSAGHRVSIVLQWDGRPCDLLIALHAKRSFASLDSYKQANPSGPAIVVLTGTDLYRDLPASNEARRSLELADRLIVLQEDAKHQLKTKFRNKTCIVYQSSDCSLSHSPPGLRFRIAVVGHLREEKDPFRAVMALHRLKEEKLEVVQLGAPLSPHMKTEAGNWMRREPRYRWLGSVPHAQALGWIARSHVLVVSSVMEGGANVICEAARIGTPVLASRMSGNLGMLGRNYPGYYRLFDDKGLAVLVEESSRKKNFYLRLKRGIANRRRLFAPAAERRGLLSVLRQLDLRL